MVSGLLVAYLKPKIVRPLIKEWFRFIMSNSEVDDQVIAFDGLMKESEHTLKDLTAEGFDAMFGVPFFSFLLSASDFIGQWTNRKFAKRVYRFIDGCSEVSREDRLIFFSDLEECEDRRRSAADIILSIIGKTDSEWKVDVLVNLMKAKIEGNIEADMFLRLSYSFQGLTYADMKALKPHNKAVYLPGATDMLLSAGLLQPYSIGYGSTWELNENGLALLQHGLLEEI